MRTLTKTFVCGLLAASSLFASLATAADWTQWQGPRRNGAVIDYTPPKAWPDALTQSWSVEVGIGHSSPLVVGDSAYVFERIDEDESLQRISLADGKVAVLDRYAAPYKMNSAARNHGKGPKSTPAYASGKIVTLGISGILSCYDLTAEKLAWRHDFSKQFKKTSPAFGTAMSPLVDGNRVIAHVGGKDNGELAAFDLETGKVVWHWDGDGPGYASPIVTTLGGVRQIVTQTQKMIVGLNSQSGELLWSLPFTTPYEQNSVSPIVVNDLLVLGGTSQPTFAVRLAAQGTKLTPERIWEAPQASLYMSTPVTRGQQIYGMTERNRGQVFALNGKTGKISWTGDPRVASNASLLLLGDQLAVITTGGKLLVYTELGDGLEQLASYTLSESPIWASTAVAGKQLLVKDETKLTLWQLP